jgi:two-component system, OmpR family, phosphate regulon sensor histidine kinase PhoR
MLISPRWIALFLAIVITSLTLAFVSFVPEVSAAILFVAGISCFVVSFFMAFYTIDLLVFKEVNKLFTTLQKLKIKDFDISRRSLIKNVNPLNKLNFQISEYVVQKQAEIDQLKQMEVFRREFLADISHELKTPIFAAQGFVHTLIDGAIDDPEVSMRFLNKAAKSLDGLDALVRDLVILTQVETGDLKMNFERVDLLQLSHDILDQLESKAKKRNTTIKLKSTSNKKIWVKVDEQRIGQVLTNLIENAIKYGRENGKVVVSFEEDKKYLDVTIEDDGPGIAQEHLSRIFERFYRVDKSRSRETGGTGLGLAIVKHIINAHDSTINVISKIDKGTRFNFKLPKA